MTGKLKWIFGIVLLVIICWHLVIGMSSKIQLAGIFMFRPEIGYVWKSGEDTESRFFWNSQRVKWEPGTTHPDFKVETTKDEGVWLPMPGYKFVDESQNLETVWEPGLLHPDFQAWSDTGEGLWIPATGYKFVYEGDEFVATVWEPGKRYEDLKIISLQQQDSFTPFQGYQFVNPGKTFDVIWTPGLINTDNTRLISGAKEGTWDVNSRHYSNDDNWLGREIAKRIIYRVF